MKIGIVIRSGFGEEGIKYNFSNLDMFKFIGFNGWYFRVFNELVEVIIELLDIIFERSWRIDEMRKIGKGRI